MKKRNLVLGFMLIMLLSMSAGLFGFAGGDGSSGDPYQVSNATELNDVRNYLSSHFIQTADIDLDVSPYNNGDGWDPIGYFQTFPAPNIHFTGSYNGQNYVIENLYINRSTSEIGLFGALNTGSSLENIFLTNINISGYNNVGGLAGFFFGDSLTNCGIESGTVTGNSSTTGGLIANCYVEVDNCYSKADVTGSSYVGGLIGSARNNITDSYSTGDVTGAGCVGGLVGAISTYWSSPISISNSYSTGNTSGRDSIGGFVGSMECGNSTNITLSNCYALGNAALNTTYLNDFFGAFVGILWLDMMSTPSATIEYCYSIGDVDCNGVSDKGFVGIESNYGGNTITYTSNFWDSEASDQSTATGATAKITTEMKTESTFTDAGWDFTTIWAMSGGVNDGYPNLQDNPPPDPPTPVELSTFTAIYANGSSLLEWTTQSESNNLGWNIYRSETELENAIQINGSLINGAGTSTEPTDYIFDDFVPVHYGTTYYYWLESISFSGQTEHFGPISLTIPESGENPELPEIDISNFYNYPNPFYSTTEISFMITEPAFVQISVHNLKGQEITQLFNGHYNANRFCLTWDGKNKNGEEVTSGIYFLKVISGNKSHLKKMIKIE